MLAEIVEPGENLLGRSFDRVEPLAIAEKKVGRVQHCLRGLAKRSRAIARPVAGQKRIMVHFCRQSGGALREQGLTASEVLRLVFDEGGD